MLSQEVIDEYILLFRRGGLPHQQQKELLDWLNADADHPAYYRKMLNLYTSIEMAEHDSQLLNMQKTIRNRIRRQILIQRFRRDVWKLTAAAAIVIAIAGSLLLLDSRHPEKGTPARTFGEAGSLKAVLTLADSEKISLTEQTQTHITTPEGNLIQQDSIGHLHIHASDSNRQQQSTCQDNTIWVPQGGEYHLTLSDGTEVWLNAETELKFPIRFSKTKRIIKLSGEAYFKVAGDTARPFIILTDNISIKVLGTSFGVRSYREENTISTTLVTGCVEVQGIQGEVHLTPSHQAIYDKNTCDLAVRAVNTELYTGWKDGKMLYDNCPLEEILCDLKRWYSFEVFYTNSEIKRIPFTLNIQKHDKINGILELMQKTGRVQFDIKENTVIVR